MDELGPLEPIDIEPLPEPEPCGSEDDIKSAKPPADPPEE